MQTMSSYIDLCVPKKTYLELNLELFGKVKKGKCYNHSFIPICKRKHARRLLLSP